MKILKSLSSPHLKKILSRRKLEYHGPETSVKKIVARVRKAGDDALIALSRQLDNVVMTRSKLKVPARLLQKRASLCDKALQKAIDQAIRNVTAYHRKQKTAGYEMQGAKGVKLGQRVLPLDSVALYIPGGQSPLFSTILMTAIPARIAGVKRIVAATPPSREGVHPAMAYAFIKLGIDTVYAVGGAQAIAALAVGTRTIEPVDKIVGPGNIYVSLAKKILYGIIDIDMVAGPSEICIVADGRANPDFIAHDLLSQAEHGTGQESSILLTPDLKLAQKVDRRVDELVGQSEHPARMRSALENYSALVVLKNLDDCAGLVNQIAPEHLELQVRNPRILLKKIRHAGSVFLGDYTCESVGDYFAGPNHVLPTNGTARFYSPLGVYHFVKRMSVVEYSKEALQKAGRSITAMAWTEELDFHAQSVLVRMD